MHEIAKVLLTFPEMSQWSLDTLTMWLRDECRCVYCSRDMLSSREMAYFFSSADHVLPRTRYHQFEACRENLVLACASCNRIKAQWDPLGKDPVPDSAAAVAEIRTRLIERSRAYISERRKRLEEQFVREAELIHEAMKSQKTAAAGAS